MLCSASWAQEHEQDILYTVSPKLKKLLTAKPAAFKELTNALTEAFSTNTVRLHYFYSDDESEARAYHFYPQSAGLPDVFICVRENQSPLDEFLCLFFETLNTRGQTRFFKLVEAAKTGAISRVEFAKEVSKVEFEATKKVQVVLSTLKFSKKETDGSYFYRRVVESPIEFEEYLKYVKKVSPQRYQLEEYERGYDLLRQMSGNSVPSSNSIAPQK